MSQVTSNTQTVTITVSNPGQSSYFSGNNALRNKATSAGSFIFLSAGMNLALAVGWAEFTFFGGVLHFLYSWFIGMMIGTILAMPLRMFASKKYILALSSLLVIISGIILASSPFNYNALLTGRYLNGMAVGLATVTYLLHASEVSVDSSRGAIVALEQYSISLGVALQMIYASYRWNSLDFPMLRMHGIMDIIFGIVAGVMLLFYVESPIDQIRLGDEAGALISVTKLTGGQVTFATTTWLEQCKMYVREHESMSLETSMRHAGAPLFKMLFFRSVMLAFCYSLPLNMALQYSTITTSTWTPIVAAICRSLGAVITLLVIDKFRRKVLSSIWIMCCGGLLLGLGIIFIDLTAILNSSSMTTAAALYIIMQTFVGFFTPYTSIFLAEAFPLRVKGFLMDVCIIAEQLLQIILINTLTTSMGYSLMAQGLIILAICILSIGCMPETRGLSLSEAQRRFRTLFYAKID